MTASVVTLGNNGIKTNGGHLNGVPHGTHHCHHLGAVVAQFGHPGSRVSQAGSIHRYPLLNHNLHLSVKKFFAEYLQVTGMSCPPRITAIVQVFSGHKIPSELQMDVELVAGVIAIAVALGLGRAPHRGGQQGINTKGLVCQGSGLANPCPQLFRLAGSSTQYTQTAGIGDRRRQGRGAGPAHACKHNGVFDTKQITQGAMQLHG